MSTTSNRSTGGPSDREGRRKSTDRRPSLKPTGRLYCWIGRHEWQGSYCVHCGKSQPKV